MAETTTWKVTTLGKPVFDSEAGPNIGYEGGEQYTIEATDEEAAEFFADHYETVARLERA